MRTTPWFLRSARVRRVAAVALAVDLGLGAFFTAMAVSAGTASAADSPSAAASTGSAVTVRWTDDRRTYDPKYVDDTQLDPSDPNQPLFKDLQVTVSQTRDLTDQGLLVSWKGGKPTSPSGAASNFLQIMQCWAAPGATGPTQEQCQWGAPNGSVAKQTGTATSTRALMSGDDADPDQVVDSSVTHAPFGLPASHLFPFWSVGDTRRANLGWTNDPDAQPPFGSAQSNEVTYARTAENGEGQSIVSLQSSLNAPYLGCGNPALTKAGYSCWIVVVPRGEFNVSGARADAHDDSLPQNPQYVAGSPLSTSAWRNRIQVKLSFTPIGASCNLGDNEIPTAGTELVAAAFASWQSSLCTQKVTLGYSQIGDGQARSSLLSGGTPLSFVGTPADPSTAGDATIEYAPVATSGLVISYLIDKNYSDDPKNPDIGANGTLVTDLRLTPLLVAKLLTQSYLNDVPGYGKNSAIRKDNPFSIRKDKEFLALNPDFKYFYDNENIAPDGLIVPFGDTDAAKAVWAWLRSDSAARSFLRGEPDPWGTTINPAYLDLDLDTDTTISSFPKADPAMFRTGDAPDPGYGTIDLRPYSANLADGGLRAVTANAGSKVIWDSTRVPPQFTTSGAQVPGSRFELAITTSQAASLYGLPTASLVRDATSTDAGVTATAEAMDKQVAKRVATDVPGVYTIDPMRSAAGGYPLTVQTYAAVNVCAASTAELTAYAKLLDHAGGAGQTTGTTLGQLPPGYAPLGEADRARARAVAADLRAEVRKPACSSHRASDAPPSTSPTPTPTTPTAPPATAGPSVPVTEVTPPAAAAPGAATPGGGATAALVDAAPLGVTPVAHVSAAARYALLAALLFALPCLVGGPSIIRAARTRR